MIVMRERSGSSKRTEDSDHVLTFTLRSIKEHVRALTKHAVNNMTSSFETACKSGSAQFTHLQYKCCGRKAGEICAGAYESGETCSFYSPIYMFHADGTM